jgi:hypothetical protein
MEKIMEDCTIIIQGKLVQDCYDFWIKNYTDCPVILSTWVDTEIDFKSLPENFTVILSPYPNDYGAQNLNLQLVSTLNALNSVVTKYVIKIRGDEYYSNLQYIRNSILVEPFKIHTSSIFFRAWQFAEYHISDHIIAGTKDNMNIIFRATKHNFDTGKVNLSKWKIDGKFHKWATIHNPEERITKSYLNAKEPFRFEKVDGRLLMKEHFNILDIDLLHPYKIKANIFKKEWTSGFIPERNYSISSIEQLFVDDPYKRNDGR